MALTDPTLIPTEIQDQIEAAAQDLSKGLVWISGEILDNAEPDSSDPRVLLLAQGFQRALTAVAMMIL